MTRIDPRWFQIAAHSSLLLWGGTVLKLPITTGWVAAVVGTALAAQWACTRLTNLPRFEWKSALISGLGLSLLLRSSAIWIILVAVTIAIVSKFVIRWNSKHIFNPTNFAIVVMLALTDRVWASPGQWGSVALIGLFILCIGSVVVHRSSRSDVTLAFLAAWALLVIGRSVWLGDPMSVPFHRLQNGVLLIFAFFMISDPRTTPDSRVGRILFASAVALGGYWIQFHFYRTNGLLWSLAFVSPLVPLIDRLLPAARFEWNAPALAPATAPNPERRDFPKEVPMLRPVVSILLVALLTVPQAADAFCGFYVAKGDAKLFNRASQVVLVRDGDRTVLTMASDYEGDPREFALVVPVPTVLRKGQIRVVDKDVVDRLDAFTAPRLVEYHDGDPCLVAKYQMRDAAFPSAAGRMELQSRAKSLGVTIEAQYTVGEYDILILSAKESKGLETWLRENGYTIPRGASEVLGSYIRQDLRFFVARVNLEEQAKLGLEWLRPIQIAYENARFMLPIRLGTVNAKGPQDLFVYALTRTGRVETTNYRTVRLPTDVDLPLHVRGEFPDFYRAMFSEQVRKERMRAVFLEYAWDMAWCDPCAADPLTPEELSKLGVFWVNQRDSNRGGAVDVFVSRLHVRYDRENFPDDLIFQETGDRTNFQARYVLHHPWKGEADCDAAREYRRTLEERRRREAQNLAELTGEDVRRILGRMDLGSGSSTTKPWWQLW